MIFAIDKTVKQDSFFDKDGAFYNLGYAVSPALCECTKETNGPFQLHLQIINPDEKAAVNLACGSYISAPILGKWDNSGKVTAKRQIFFIISIEQIVDEYGAVHLDIYADHITYKLRNRQILKSYWDEHYTKCYMPCDDALKQVASVKGWAFTIGETDIADRKNFMLESTTSCTGAMLDETGIMRFYGAELHRDNFYISGKQQKEFCTGNSATPAFRFLAGKEISGIVETIDYTNVITALNIVLTNGYTRRLYVNPEKVGLSEHIEAYYESSAETDDERIAEAMAYFATVNHPTTGYEVTVNALKKSSKYRDMSGLLNCDIGDVGIVESSALGLMTVQKVTKTVEDVLRHEYTEIVLGNIPGSLSRTLNNTVVVNADTSQLDTSGCAGFTATIIATENENKITLQGYIPADSSTSAYDVYIDTGDLYTALLSEFEERTLVHKYPFKGRYILQYSAIGTAQHDKIEGTAIQGAIGSTSVNIDDVVFNKDTAVIGTMVTYTDGYPQYMPLFPSCTTISKITIQDSVRYISPFAFLGCFGLTDVYFGGSIAEWTKIQSVSDPYNNGWQSVYNVSVHCTDGDIIQIGTLGERS